MNRSWRFITIAYLLLAGVEVYYTPATPLYFYYQRKSIFELIGLDFILVT